MRRPRAGTRTGYLCWRSRRWFCQCIETFSFDDEYKSNAMEVRWRRMGVKHLLMGVGWVISVASWFVDEATAVSVDFI